MKMGKRKLVVHRKGYYVPPTTYERKGKIIHRKGYYVPPTTYEIEDRGAPGRGKKVLPELRKGLMTKEAIAIGLLKPGERISDLSKREIAILAEHLRKKYGQRRAVGMFLAQLVFRKRMRDGFKDLMEYGMKVAKGEPGVLD
jgi:hypothetical protein